MIIHPIAVVDEVIEEYERYLLTEFRARDLKLREALNEALARPLFLAQEPFFQAHRPFMPGRAWRELGLDARLAAVMEERSGAKTAFLHQSEAIAHLLAPTATPLAVTTGTGSGKTECFLLPVIQNAIEDSVRHPRSGLTAILVYPMNALANDQAERIKLYLEQSGHTHVRVARYDQSTKQDERAELRKSPPHILLTNYMMLEYLLVRPADRDKIFANHRCRYLVLDEIHTYRGSLGSNIALLVRRLKAHLAAATQDWGADDRTDLRRFPRLVSVATSATIKSVDETGRAPAEVRRLREEAVQEFVGKIVGDEPASVRVLGEELRPLVPPPEATWPAAPVDVDPPPLGDAEAVRRTLARLAGLPEDAPVDAAVRRAGIIWVLHDLLAKKPLATSGIVAAILERVPERRGADPAAVTREVRAALYAGASLGDVPGALRLRAHRFVRGGWRFHRCIDHRCGRLYAMGEGACECGRPTAPLLLCRSCGADALHLCGAADPTEGALRPRESADGELLEWVLYDRTRFATSDEDLEDDRRVAKQMKGRPVVHGSFDPATGFFAADDTTYPLRASLAPARTRCLVCGGSAGAYSVLTPVALGTSAALRVLAEGVVGGLARQHAGDGTHDGKERILVFADSRQDAAHQARFITYAGRYDRMRRRLWRLLREAGGTLTFGKAVQGLMAKGFEQRDNPRFKSTRVRSAAYLSAEDQARAQAWEEAPLLDDIAVSAGYRATVFNLGLVGVRYGQGDQLTRYIADQGAGLCGQLGLTAAQMHYLCRCVLDEMRTRRALSRPMLCFHPASPSCPEEFKVHAEWERRLKTPVGYPWTGDERTGTPLAHLDDGETVDGVDVTNAWRRGKGGSPPRLQRIFQHLLKRLGRQEGAADDLVALLDFLVGGNLLIPNKLYGYAARKTNTLLQVNADAIELVLLDDADRLRCNVCNVRMPWVVPGSPCRACHGEMEPWHSAEVLDNRYAQRILSAEDLPLVAGEHTAQITGDARLQLESDFKGPPSESPINVLACSPTLEMGIDVGTLDAILMRNVPPRPDNYAQRGGRAGRRSRVGVVVGYARNTPHDQYFYDKPQEMIAGEVAPPGIGLGNRDVVIRHLNAIAFGNAEPGLAGRMEAYLTFRGEAKQEAIDGLVAAFEREVAGAADLALTAFGPEVLGPAQLATREALLAVLGEQPARIRDLFDRVRHQVLRLQQQASPLFEKGAQKWQGVNALELIKRLLGIPDDRGAARGEGEADDRGAGNPMRRFAEFGLLPGYEFPSEPATLRLLHDRDEEEPISVVRRFGLAQYQPDAPAHARGHRWRVAGLDMTSPWNPRSQEASWVYRVCSTCTLHFDAQAHVKCPRCTSTDAGQPHPGFEFGGFVAVRDDSPVLEEEDRFALANLLRCYPQWDGRTRARYLLPTGWVAELCAEESIRWVNEWKPPKPSEQHRTLRDDARGFYLCPACGRILKPGDPPKSGKANKAPKGRADADPYEHATGCVCAGQPPVPLAITTKTPASTLRIRVDVPLDYSKEEYQRWGLSLGYALRTGLRHLYMLDGPEIEFELEPLWPETEGERRWQRGALTFIDPAVGGSGFLERAAAELHVVARHALEHLEHDNCTNACYRCLKSYQNQRFHGLLSWPHAVPSLETLAAAAPELQPLDAADLRDPRPWLEAYDAGVGSPLELKFLRVFEQAGLVVEKQVPIAPTPGGRPITAADFAISEKRIAIYVDGAAFHVGANLRRDRKIRAALRAADPPWRVVELTAKDLRERGPQLDALLGGGR